MCGCEWSRDELIKKSGVLLEKDIFDSAVIGQKNLKFSIQYL
jgi:hypothetical protein